MTDEPSRNRGDQLVPACPDLHVIIVT